MRLSLVTVTYNSSHILRDFVRRLDLSNHHDCELIIVDSGSSDAENTIQIAREEGATVLVSDKNIGYGRGSNLGASAATGQWLAFVNPDVSVGFDQLLTLVSIAEAGDLDCVGPQVVGPDGREKMTWGRTIKPPWRQRDRGYSEDGSFIFAETISGCCMALSASKFAALGGFDSDFFMFCEEMDLHRRLKDSGGRTAVTRDVVVETPGGASSLGVTDRWRSVERMVGHTRYMFKHFTYLEGLIAVLTNLSKILVEPRFGSRQLSLRQYFEGIRRSVEST
ncbi:glycosyltransferase family 2 protein [Arthrobacter sp. MMS24-T111]